MDSIDLLVTGHAWTAGRIAAITPGGLASPTPCGRWSLGELLEHVLDTLGVFVDAVDGPAERAPSSDPATAFGELAERSRRGWAASGALERTYELRFGTMSGPVAAGANLLEVVVHGWDVGQATGEAIDIPTELAEPILAFARAAITDDGRGDAFAADLGVGDTPAEQLVSFLGRKVP